MPSTSPATQADPPPQARRDEQPAGRARQRLARSAVPACVIVGPWPNAMETGQNDQASGRRCEDGTMKRMLLVAAALDVRHLGAGPGARAGAGAGAEASAGARAVGRPGAAPSPDAAAGPGSATDTGAAAVAGAAAVVGAAAPVGAAAAAGAQDRARHRRQFRARRVRPLPRRQRDAGPSGQIRSCPHDGLGR